jgi:hypothetical protein
MIKALLISNNIESLGKMFASNEQVQYDIAVVDGEFNPDLSGYDLLIVPNGSDHMSMLKIKLKVAAFLHDGKAVFCFDGWFTKWLPGNQWVMDNSKKTIEVRYRVKTDRYNLFENINIDSLIFSHGISGWWACGYIDASAEADIVIADTWDRPIIVLDEKTTNGLIIMTASGPLADFDFGGHENNNSKWDDLHQLYKHMLNLVISRRSVFLSATQLV